MADPSPEVVAVMAIAAIVGRAEQEGFWEPEVVADDILGRLRSLPVEIRMEAMGMRRDRLTGTFWTEADRG